jgi:hypothetical protein
VYAWIFRNLPGPLWVRILTSVILVAAAVTLMIEFLFPWVSQFTSLTDSTIGSVQQP